MRKGFTLIELLATIVILAIISTITVPIMIDKLNYFKQKSYDNMVSSIENAAEEYVEDNRDNLDELDDFGYMNVTIETLLSDGYLDGDVINPKTNISVPKEDVVYVALSDKNKITVLYDPDQGLKPRITLNGPNIIRVKLNGTYRELSAIARDKNGNDISSSVQIQGTVNTAKEGTYTLDYSVLDSMVVERYVIVTSDFPKDDIEKPVLSSNVPGNYIETHVGVNITMPVVSATDNVDATVPSVSPTSNNVDINNTGTYYLKYNYTDAAGNKADTLSIKVVVKP